MTPKTLILLPLLLLLSPSPSSSWFFNNEPKHNKPNKYNNTIHPNLQLFKEKATNPLIRGVKREFEGRGGGGEEGYMPPERKRVFHEEVCEKDDENHHFWKYFKEAGSSNHMDVRYFDPAIDNSHHLRRVALSLLWREFCSFCKHHNLLFWISHGTLLGWYRTGKLIPWDNDIDVESTADEVVRMGALNGTRVGRGRYLFDVNAHSTKRQLDHSNIVDARFIDTLNGLYVDVAGVTYDPTNNMYHDKEPFIYDENDLFPLQVVVLEGERVFAPNRPKELLLLDYGGIGLVEQEYNGYTFNEAEHRWERKRELRR